MKSYLWLMVLVAMAYGIAPDSIPVTTWAGPPGSHPGTYEEWIAQNPIDPNLQALPVQDASPPGDNGTAAIYVEASLYGLLYHEIRDLYIPNLQEHGYGFVVRAVLPGTPPWVVRDSLRADWLRLNVVGALLVGRIQPAWYQVTNDIFNSWQQFGYAEWPCDLFYMDLDGEWLDTLRGMVHGSDTIYDGHSGADTAADIYVGRLWPPDTVGDRVEALRSYFRKDNAFWHDTLRLNPDALFFIDDDWRPFTNWADDLALAYPDTQSYFDPSETRAAVYRPKLNTPHAWVSVFVHSYPVLHRFYFPGGGSDEYGAGEYFSQNPPANFYNFFACSFIYYTTPYEMANGGTAIFNPGFGVGALGSTKTGSMTGFDKFYGPLAQGVSLGEAFKEWFNDYVMATPRSHRNTCWHYGMTLLGDPFLQPVLQNDVTAKQILAPVGTIPTGTVDPQAQVRNLGKVVAAFAVTFEITKDGQPYYADTQDVAGLAPNATLDVSFASVSLDRGVYHTKARTGLAGDDNPLNDSVTGWVVVGMPAPGWQQMAYVPIGPKGKCVKDGGALAHYDPGDTGFMYALKGNGRLEFYRYNIVTNEWLSKESVPAIGSSGKKKRVKKGGCITQAEGLMYAAKGGGTTEWWQYDPALSGSPTYPWVQKTDIPLGAKACKEGCGAAPVKIGDTSYIFFLKGSGTQEFYRYNTFTNTWETRADAPSGASGKPFKNGSCICSDGNGTIYALKANYNELFAYDVAGNSWTAKPILPLIGSSGKKKKAKAGAGLAPLAGRIYALKGGNTWEFWGYLPDSDRWTQAEDIPVGSGKTVKGGGALACGDTSLWALKGNNSLEFHRFTAYPGIPMAPFPPSGPPPGPGPNESQIASGDDIRQPCWNAAGDWVCFVKPDQAGRRQVWRAKFDGSDSLELTALEGDCAKPIWGPDSLITFEVELSGSPYSQVAVVSDSGGTVSMLSSDSTDHCDPAFDPSGTQIVYSADDDSTGYRQVFCVSAQGGTPTRLTWSEFDHEQPKFRNSTQIVFVREGDDQYDHLFVTSPGSGEESQLSSLPFDHSCPVVAVNNGAITYAIAMSCAASSAAWSQVGLLAPWQAGEAVLTSGQSDFEGASPDRDCIAIHAVKRGSEGDAICRVNPYGYGWFALTDELSPRDNPVSMVNALCGLTAAYERPEGIFRLASKTGGGGGQSSGSSLLAVDGLMPNPAKGPVRILWHVRRESHVSLKIYDIAGKLVNKLIDQKVKPGSYVTVWSHADSRGRRLAGGIYFCTLEADDVKLSRKVILTE